MRKLLIIAFIPFCAFTQDIPFSDIDTIFLDENWVRTSDRNEAVYYRGIKMDESDSILYVEDYYFDTKTLQMTGSYDREMKSNQQKGEFVFYYRNQKIKSTYHFIDGKINGKVYKYYENGNLQSIENFKHGFRSDTIVSFYENGAQKSVQVINPNFSRDDREEAEKEIILLDAWDQEGNHQVKNGTGRYIRYDSDGNKEVQIDYSNGFPDGEWIRFVEGKRKVACIMTFKEGRFIKGEIYERGPKDIFASLYRSPRFPSGIKGLDQYVNKHIGKCEEIFSHEIQIVINIDVEGNVFFEQVLNGEVSNCQLEELYEMVEKMPKWIPAVKDGYYTDASYIIRIKY